jgi:hypothetical protein
VKRLWQVLAFALVTLPLSSFAQTPDGLELTLEGSSRFVRGQPLRFLATAFEIRRGELTPAAGAQVRVIVSHQAGMHAAEVVTASDGRAMIELPMNVEEDMREFRVFFDVRHAGLQRTFDIGLTARVSPILSLRSLTQSVLLGSPMIVLGRVRDERGLSRPEAQVRLRFRQGQRLIQDVHVITDAEGSYAAEFVPGATGEYSVRASIDGHGMSVSSRVAAPQQLPLRLRVESAAAARPGDALPIQVSVRDADGLPVEGALLVRPPSSAEQNQEPIRTDASGRASFTWNATEGSKAVGVRVAGFATVTQDIPVRVSIRAFHVAARAEHGALIAEVPTEVYLHVVGVDGYPRAGQEVTLRGARFADQSAQSDDQGVARVEVILASGGLDRCGGTSAVAVEVIAEGEISALCLPVDVDGTLRVRAERRPSNLTVTIARPPSQGRAPVSVSVYRVVDGARRVEPVVQLVTRESTVEIPEAGLRIEGGAVLEVRARLLIDGREVRGDLAWVEAPHASESESGTLRRIAVDRITAYARQQRAPMSLAGFASALAGRTPRDISASYVLRDGDVMPLPMPPIAVQRGLLRDAQRLRTRFQTGRLGLVFRAVEEYVAEHGPDAITRRQGARRVFTASALEAILEDGDVGSEGLHDLGGGELRLDSLRAMAPAFRFENVARRVTRERLLRTLQNVQAFVRERELDLPFARQGTPNDWWSAIEGSGVRSRDDGWGRPLRFVRRNSRFTGIDPVRGWELVSAGPDGRFGSADDVWDPSARVLPTGSLYARAMDEERMVRELQGVALGQALLGEASSVSPSATAAGFPLPAPLVPRGEPTRAQLLEGDETQRFDGPILEYRFAGAHRTLMRRRSERRPPPASLTSPFPTELRAGSALVLPISFVGERSSEGQPASIEIEAEGIEFTWQRAPDGVLSATQALRGVAVLRPTADHFASIRIRLVSGGTVLTESVHEVRILPQGIPRSQRAGQRVTDEAPWNVRFAVPAPARVEVIAVAPERAALDPALWETIRSRPAFSAWADTIAGRTPDSEELRALREEPPSSPLEGACALVVWSAIDSEEARGAFAALVASLPRRGENPQAAAILAAIGPIATPSASTASDAVGRWIERLRRQLRDMDSQNPRNATLQAAGLLLADPADRTGLAALQRAQNMPSIRHTAFPSLIRALARHATGESIVFDERWMRRRPLHAQVSPEAAFWHLAASAYGVFESASGDVIVHQGGQTHRLSMEDGRARFSFDAQESVELRVESEGNALVRVEARYEQPESARENAPLELELHGEPGFAQSLASFELIVRAPNGSERSEVAINLPAAVQTRAAIRVLGEINGVTAVRTVPGGLRLNLSAMEEGSERRLPLPLYWVGAGERTMSVAAWEVSKPWNITATEPRVMEVAENW